MALTITIPAEWTPEAWEEVQTTLQTDLEEQLEAQGLKLVKVLPNRYTFGAVIANADNTKWMHVTTPDVRDTPGWLDQVRLRRMSSERDWKGDAFHYTPWSEVGAAAVTYFGDEYDDEIL